MQANGTAVFGASRDAADAIERLADHGIAHIALITRFGSMRIGLLCPEQRSRAGYRLYGPGGVERLGLICSYKRAGLSLGDIRVLLEEPERESEKVLRERLLALDGQVLELRIQQRAIPSLLRSLDATDSEGSMDKETWVEILRESGMDESNMERWHAGFEHNAPQAHRSFLAWLGIPEAEATRIRTRSRRLARDRR